MIDTDRYEGHTPTPWTVNVHTIGKDREITAIVIESNMTTHSNCVLAEVEVENKYAEADAQLIADAPLFLEFIQKIVEEWSKPNQCNQAFGKDVRWLMYEYGLITFNEETRRYEVIE
jgi:hypothetical protein|tara:strand:+ start:237 stop:587 length:351 start_codon:yes stop_codon:yes gene_type:complete